MLFSKNEGPKIGQFVGLIESILNEARFENIIYRLSQFVAKLGLGSCGDNQDGMLICILSK